MNETATISCTLKRLSGGKFSFEHSIKGPPGMVVHAMSVLMWQYSEYIGIPLKQILRIIYDMSKLNAEALSGYVDLNEMKNQMDQIRREEQ